MNSLFLEAIPGTILGRQRRKYFIKHQLRNGRNRTNAEDERHHDGGRDRKVA